MGGPVVTCGAGAGATCGRGTMQETKDGSSCVILFPSQRQQVLRLLRETAAAVVLDRACSAMYGPGASKYSPELMASWQDRTLGDVDVATASWTQMGEVEVFGCPQCILWIGRSVG